MDQVENKQFTCPKCGSHKFGSSLATGTVQNGTWHGHCHGVVQVNPAAAARNCGFIWPRSEDAKYFRGTGTFYPASGAGQAPPRKP